jgi:hypothetical protein
VFGRSSHHKLGRVLLGILAFGIAAASPAAASPAAASPAAASPAPASPAPVTSGTSPATVQSAATQARAGSSQNGSVARAIYWVDTWATTAGSNCPGFAVPGRTCGAQGRLYAGRNYVYCKTWGENWYIYPDTSAYNHWWLLTDLDTLYPGGRNPAYVSAFYLTGGRNYENDSAYDVNGRVIPTC